MALVDKNISQPSAAMLVIGDEILSGRTQDLNTQFIATRLTEVGINLSEVRVVPDSNSAIVSAVNALRVCHKYLFTSGGIGPTHDDITADAIANAFKVDINVRDDAKRILSTYYSDGEKSLNEARLRMARIPETADLIENPISGAPGYIIENVYVMAGVPKIFKSMLKTLLPNLKKVRFKSLILNKSIRLTVSNAGVRSVDKKGSFDQFIKSTKAKNLSFRLKKLKKSLLSKSA